MRVSYSMYVARQYYIYKLSISTVLIIYITMRIAYVRIYVKTINYINSRKAVFDLLMDFFLL